MEAVNRTTARNAPGIWGWLSAFIVGQVVTIILLAVDVEGMVEVYRGAPSEAQPSMLGPFLGVVILEVLWIVASLQGLRLIFQRRREAPSYWSAFLLALGPLGAAIGVCTWLMLDSVGPLTEDMQRAIVRAAVRALVVGFIWAVYWLRSRKVKAVFGWNGSLRAWLDRVWLSPIELKQRRH